MQKKQVVVITGASRGIGRACALELADWHVALVLMGRDPQELQKVSELCEAKGAYTHVVAVDLLNSHAIEQEMKEVQKRYGHIDVLINNAGIWIEKPFEQGDMSIWDEALDVNLKAPIHLTRHALQYMPEGGSIIFIGSTASRRTYGGGTNYCAGKFGLLGFAGALYEDVRGKGIKVSSILPGVVNTDMHKGDESLAEEKMIQPIDVAKTVRFILNMPANVCPTEITLMPQKNPKSYHKT